MRVHASTSVAWLTGILCAGMPCVFAQTQQDDKQAEVEAKRKADQEAEKAARDKVAEFNKALSGVKNPADIAAAIRTLNVKHDIILDQLIRMLNGPGDETILTAIIETLVALDDPRSVPALTAQLQKRLLKPRDNVPICIALLKAVGHFGDRSAAGAVAQALDCNDNAIATEACSVCARIKDPVLVGALIKLLRESEQQDTFIPTGRGGGGAALGGGFNAVNRRKELREPAQKALQEVTGQSFGSSRDWQSWWSANRSRWKPADPKNQ